MTITNFVITTNGAGYAESDGLNPIASTEATVVIKNNIVSIVLSDGSSWKSTPLENCTLNGNPLSTDPRVAIDELALAGFRTPSGGSGGGAVDSWNGQTGNVVYDVLRKTNGVTPADSYNEDLHHNGWYKTVDNTNKVLAGLAKLDTGEFGASNPHGQLELYKRDGKPFGGLGLDLGATIWGYGNNDGAQNLSLVASTLAGGALPSATEIIGLWNYTNKLVTLLGSGQLKLENYTSGAFQGIGNKLAINNGNIVQMNTFSQSEWVSNSITTTQVGNGDNLNLLDLISDSDKSANGTIEDVNELSITSDVTGNYIQFNYNQRREKIEIRVQYGVDHGGTDFFRTSIRRKSDDSLVFEQPFGSNGGDDIRGSAQIISYIFDSSDPFIDGGIYISFDNDSGGNADIGFFNGVGLNILIFRTLI